MKHTKYIVLTKELYGHWGIGFSLNEALLRCAASGASIAEVDMATKYVFRSPLPFAPADREATEEEADCWVGADGWVYWLRCNRWEVGSEPKNSPPPIQSFVNDFHKTSALAEFITASATDAASLNHIIKSIEHGHTMTTETKNCIDTIKNKIIAHHIEVGSPLGEH